MFADAGEAGSGATSKNRCEHGDVVSHVLAEVQTEIEGQSIQVQVGVAPNLPMSLLLGTDVPQLAMLLQFQGSDPVTQQALPGDNPGSKEMRDSNPSERPDRRRDPTSQERHDAGKHRAQCTRSIK